MKKLIIVVLIIYVGIWNCSYLLAAQTVTQNIRFNITDTTTVTTSSDEVTFSVMEKDGKISVVSAADTTTLEYSTITASDSSRAITVNFSGGDTLLDGMHLEIKIKNGQTDSSENNLVLSNSPQKLIENIKSGDAKKGAGAPTLQYELKIDDPSKIKPGQDKNVMLTFTVGDVS